MRVRRRLEQLGHNLAQAPAEELDSVKKDMEIEVLERDKRDSQRSVAPTVAAEDAILIDNSAQTLTEVVQNMYDAVANRGLICKR